MKYLNVIFLFLFCLPLPLRAATYTLTGQQRIILLEKMKDIINSADDTNFHLQRLGENLTALEQGNLKLLQDNKKLSQAAENIQLQWQKKLNLAQAERARFLKSSIRLRAQIKVWRAAALGLGALTVVFAAAR